MRDEEYAQDMTLSEMERAKRNSKRRLEDAMRVLGNRCSENTNFSDGSKYCSFCGINWEKNDPRPSCPLQDRID